jgi:hypothetical protein
MTGQHPLECPNCQGTGLVRHHLILEQRCPLCCGTGLVAGRGSKAGPSPVHKAEIEDLHLHEYPSELAPLHPAQDHTLAAEDRHAPVIAGHEEPADAPPNKQGFIKGVEPRRKNFTARLRSR